MSVEIEFPLEFVVEGTPVSHQAKERRSIEQWKSRVIEASRPVLPQGHFATEAPLAITLFYFPADPMEGDLDNIVKPILDALERHIYINDKQIHRILVQKFELEDSFESVGFGGRSVLHFGVRRQCRRAVGRSCEISLRSELAQTASWQLGLGGDHRHVRRSERPYLGFEPAGRSG